MRIFGKKLDIRALMSTQVEQYSEKLLLSGVVPPNQEIIAKTTVANLGHFMCLFITGKFTSLANVTDAKTGLTYVVDTGIEYLRGKWSDVTGQRTLFSDYIPLSLFLSPGREKAQADNAYTDILDTTGISPREIALAAAKGDTLFYPQEFEYLYSANSEIMLAVKNASNHENSFDICLHGIRIRAEASNKGMRGY